MLDLVVRDGTVVDGTGAPAYRADVGVRDGRIVAIGRIGESARDEIAAEGHLVAPGFVEIHTHMDAQVFWDGLGTCSVWHGITTSVMGNCGFTLAPCAETDMDLCLRSLERAEDMSRQVLLAGIPWSWETFAEYMDAVDRVDKGINYAAMIGHSTLRSWAMGERAFSEEATQEDLARMRRQLEQAMRAGAVGFTTSRSNAHSTADDQPVASRLASWGELVSLLDVLRELGTGLFELANLIPRDPEERLTYNRRLADLAVASGRPTTYACVAPAFAPDLGQEYLALADETASRGGRLVNQVMTRPFSTVLGFKTNLPMDCLPGWKEMRRRPLAEQRTAFLDPFRRARLVDEALHGTYRRTRGAEPRPPDWATMFPAGGPTSVAELATSRGTSPVDVLIDLSLERDFDQFFVQPTAKVDPARQLEMLRHPRSVIALSDSGAHVSQILDTSMPTHFLAHWVRQEGAFTWEQAIRKLTADPARLMGFRTRGIVVEGAVADLAVIDPDRITLGPIEAANDLPAAGTRLTQKAVGIRATVVAGTPLLRDGEHTGAYPGRLLRGPLAAGAPPLADRSR